MLRFLKVTRTFQNDMSNIRSRDDVLTLLVHLGYLAYDSAEKEVYIPNQEVADEFKNAVECSGWEGVSSALQLSGDLRTSFFCRESIQISQR